ncbi:MAG: ABC transporter permease subunit [Candidatus Marinimicrobia bacterium]|nr:ABC transporter permease subunit [Candidatus Neomarinimicrobiota bacterium]MBL7022814.1 ABC transporter permease subunit [Candidatus Neomarinimicrobiota bacterium]MBL7109465.1 ABC transporter permease subunit [Candidatus Neomarinimicrobiota bacterium]
MKKEKQLSQSILRKRLRKFKSIKRGYYSLWIIVILYILAELTPILITNKPLLVRYNEEFYFPLAKAYSASTFGVESHGEPNYRELDKIFAEQDGNWAIMPLYPYHPNESLLSELSPNVPPTAPTFQHLFGTDNRGRDVFARLVYGFKYSIRFAIIVTTISYILGIIVGATLGFFGKKIDILGQRIIEIFSSIPFLFMIIIIRESLKEPPGFLGLAFILSAFGWMGMTYYIRGEFYREKAKDYVSAAVSMGASNRQVMFKHILPNALTPVITFAPFAIVGAIFSLVSLDFLGFGLVPPTPSWGEIANQGISEFRYWLIGAPMLATFTTLLLITFIGEAIREAFDPKVYSRLR